MIKYIILMLSLFLMGCFGEKTTNTSTDSESCTDSINPTIDRNNLYKPYPLYKDENSGAKLTMKQQEYSISKIDTIKYEISNIDNYKVTAGNHIELEFWENNNWIDVPHDKSNIDIAYIIWKDASRSFKFNWSNVDSSFFKKGKYRLIKVVEVIKQKVAPGERISLYAEFLLVE